MQPADQRVIEPPLPYNGLALDRAAGRRSDETWLRGVARLPGSRLLALWQGIMVGFRARATGEEINVDDDELTEARWFTRAELAAHRAARPRTHGDSIGTYLLDAWLAEAD